MSPARAPGSEEAWPPQKKGESLPGAGLMAMRIFLLSLAVPFITLVIAYVVLRVNVETWLPAGARPIPVLFWVSTAIILFSSLTVHLSFRAVRADRQLAARRLTLATFWLGVAFMVSQTMAWRELAVCYDAHGVRLFAVTFYLLTGVHAFHVVAGLIFQAVVTLRVYRGRYWSLFHPGVHYSVMYWDFLAAMWILVFLVLVLGT